MTRYSSVQRSQRPLSASVLSTTTFGSGTETQDTQEVEGDMESRYPFYVNSQQGDNNLKNVLPGSEKFIQPTNQNKRKKRFRSYLLDDDNDPTYICWLSLFCFSILTIIIVGT